MRVRQTEKRERMRDGQRKRETKRTRVRQKKVRL